MRLLLLSTVAASTMFSANVRAADVQAVAGPQTGTPVETGAPQASGADTGIADIIVTAERRTSTTQKTPATIETLSGQQLTQRGITSLRDALQNVSGTVLQDNPKGANISIRGVGTSLESATGDPGVSTNQDGVYLRQASTILLGLYDVSRIEVLKGPQGTLYGRNSTGGVVNILSNDPKPDFDYFASATAGNYSLLRTEGAVNVPITSDLAMRAAFGSESRDGYLSTGQNDADRIAGRLKLLWTPSADVRILAGVSYGHDGGRGQGSVPITEPEGSYNAVVSHLPAASLNQKFLTIFGSAEMTLGAVKLTFIPTYSYFNFDYVGTNFGIYSHTQDKERQGTAELRVSSIDSSWFQWVAGLYYYADKYSDVAELLDLGIVTNTPEIRTRSYAAFGDVTVPVSNDIRVVGGIRYTADRRRQTGATLQGGPATFGPFEGRLNSDAVTYRAGLQYDVAPRVMLYATYSKGYKAGGFFADLPGFNTYEPEHLASIEGGVKSRFFDNRVQINLSGFHYSYDNYQVSNLGIGAFGGLALRVFNAQGTTKIYGGELQVSVRPTTSDQFDVSVTPIHSRFGTFVIPPFIDVTGKRVPNAPGVSGTAGYQHVFSIANGANVTGRVQTFFSSDYWTDFSHFLGSKRDGYTKTDLNLTYNSPDGRWSIGGFVRNVEDSYIVTYTATGLTAEYGLQAPRTYGLTFGIHG